MAFADQSIGPSIEAAAAPSLSPKEKLCTPMDLG